MFLSIGTYRFESDGQSTVTFQTQGTEDGLVVVDGVLFVPAWEETDTGIAEKPKAEKPIHNRFQECLRHSFRASNLKFS
jgi:hypothetical protein